MHSKTSGPRYDSVAAYFDQLHDCDVVEATAERIELTNIPHSATHMLPGGFGALRALGNHWEDWDVEYVDNGGTVGISKKADKNVVITRTS